MKRNCANRKKKLMKQSDHDHLKTFLLTLSYLEMDENSKSDHRSDLDVLRNTVLLQYKRLLVPNLF